MTDILENPYTFPKIVYYNTDHSQSVKCTNRLSEQLKITWSMPSTWQDLMTELENGEEFLAFHVDMISKSIHPTPIEFTDAIKTMMRFIPDSKDIKIGVIITPITTLQTVRELQKSGVQGILLDINYYRIEELQVALNAFVNGISYWPKHIINKLPGAEKKSVSKSGITLTPRQAQIFKMIKERGASNKAIAKALGISESTVKLHVTEIFKKYGVRNRTQLAVFSSA
jgi:DNA-binding NarL/FixJ family response regulator